MKFKAITIRRQMKASHHIDGATNAALELAHHASLVLDAQQSGKGLHPVIYRKRIAAIKDIVWCAANDLGQAKRLAVRAQIRSRNPAVTNEVHVNKEVQA